jgi:glycosyltransferase involved in cell wall biosynthesis
MKAAPPRPAAGTERPIWRVARYPFETGVNPYQTLFHEALRRHRIELVPDRPFTASALIRGRLRIDALHFHWRLDRLYGSQPTTARIALARLRLGLARRLGYRIVWTIHELASREHPGSREPMADALARCADVLLCHDPDLADRAAAELGIDRARIDVMPHGPLTPAYSAAREPRHATRERLGLDRDDIAFLSFGAIREYKELGLVLAAFDRLAAPGARLVIAGAPNAAEVRELLHRAADADRRIVLIDRFVPDEDVRELFAACDIAVLGRRDGWTSGALVLALSLGLPTVVANRPAYVRLIGNGSAGWAFDPDGGTDALAATLQVAFDTPPEARAAAGAAAVSGLAEQTWESAAMLVARRLDEADAAPRGVAPAPTGAHDPASREPVVVDA